MKAYTFLAIAALSIAAAPTSDQAEGVPVRLDSMVTNHSKLGPAPARAAGSQGPLSVTFLPAEWPNLTVKATKPWDWSPYGRFLLDVKNPGSDRIAIGVRIDDDPSADGT